MARILIALATAIALLAGCASDEGPSIHRPRPPAEIVTVDGVPFLATATAGPGAHLRNGLQVAPGSRLLAEVRPVRSAPGSEHADDRSWEATVVVTGDPRAVLPGYSRQAARLGMPVPPIRCTTSAATTSSPAMSECTGRSEGSGGTRSFELDYHRSDRRTGLQPLSHLSLRYTDRDGALAPVTIEPGRDPLADLRVGPLAWGALPTTGQAFEPGTDTNPAMAVMDGVHLVGPAGVDEAILRVDGDLATVVGGYLDAGNSADVMTRRWTDDGVKVVERTWTNGDTYALTTYQRTGHPTWLVVRHTPGD